MSVRKREWTTPSGEQREAWVVDYVDGNGKRRLKTFQKKKEADAYRSTVDVEVAKGTHTPSSQSITVRKAGELWLEACEAAGLESATIDSYRQHVDLHLVPYLGSLKLSQLTTGGIRQFQDDLRKGKPAPGETTGTARSPAMVKRVVVSLGTMLADMQERNYVARNVVRDLRANRRGRDGRAERRERGKLQVGVDIPSPVEIGTLLGSLRDDRWKPLLITAAFTGLRASELRGLRWSDVDLGRQELHVRQRADKRSVMGAPKSATSERSLPLPSFVVTALRAWQKKCPKGELDLVFPSGTGGAENYSNVIKRGLIPSMVAAGLTVPVLDDAGKPVVDKSGKAVVTAKYSGLHALRHFFASWCINRTVDGGLQLPLKVVSERMGHATIGLTANTYGHIFPRGDDGDELDKAVEALLMAPAATRDKNATCVH